MAPVLDNSVPIPTPRRRLALPMLSSSPSPEPSSLGTAYNMTYYGTSNNKGSIIRTPVSSTEDIPNSEFRSLPLSSKLKKSDLKDDTENTIEGFLNVADLSTPHPSKMLSESRSDANDMMDDGNADHLKWDYACDLASEYFVTNSANNTEISQVHMRMCIEKADSEFTGSQPLPLTWPSGKIHAQRSPLPLKNLKPKLQYARFTRKHNRNDSVRANSQSSFVISPEISDKGDCISLPPEMQFSQSGVLYSLNSDSPIFALMDELESDEEVDRVVEGREYTPSVIRLNTAEKRISDSDNPQDNAQENIVVKRIEHCTDTVCIQTGASIEQLRERADRVLQAAEQAEQQLRESLNRLSQRCNLKTSCLSGEAKQDKSIQRSSFTPLTDSEFIYDSEQHDTKRPEELPKLSIHSPSAMTEDTASIGLDFARGNGVDDSTPWTEPTFVSNPSGITFTQLEIQDAGNNELCQDKFATCAQGSRTQKYQDRSQHRATEVYETRTTTQNPMDPVQFNSAVHTGLIKNSSETRLPDDNELRSGVDAYANVMNEANAMPKQGMVYPHIKENPVKSTAVESSKQTQAGTAQKRKKLARPEAVQPMVIRDCRIGQKQPKSALNSSLMTTSFIGTVRNSSRSFDQISSNDTTLRQDDAPSRKTSSATQPNPQSNLSSALANRMKVAPNSNKKPMEPDKTKRGNCHDTKGKLDRKRCRRIHDSTKKQSLSHNIYLSTQLRYILLKHRVKMARAKEAWRLRRRIVGQLENIFNKMSVNEITSQDIPTDLDTDTTSLFTVSDAGNIEHMQGTRANSRGPSVMVMPHSAGCVNRAPEISLSLHQTQDVKEKIDSNTMDHNQQTRSYPEKYKKSIKLGSPMAQILQHPASDAKVVRPTIPLCVNQQMTTADSTMGKGTKSNHKSCAQPTQNCSHRRLMWFEYIANPNGTDDKNTEIGAKNNVNELYGTHSAFSKAHFRTTGHTGKLTQTNRLQPKGTDIHNPCLHHDTAHDMLSQAEENLVQTSQRLPHVRDIRNTLTECNDNPDGSSSPEESSLGGLLVTPRGVQYFLASKGQYEKCEQELRFPDGTSLQTIFEERMSHWISRSRERQKRIKLASEHRRYMKAMNEERARLFASDFGRPCVKSQVSPMHSRTTHHSRSTFCCSANQPWLPRHCCSSNVTRQPSRPCAEFEHQLRKLSLGDCNRTFLLTGDANIPKRRPVSSNQRRSMLNTQRPQYKFESKQAQLRANRLRMKIFGEKVLRSLLQKRGPWITPTRDL